MVTAMMTIMMIMMIMIMIMMTNHVIIVPHLLLH
jgi:hypothetical protein